MEQQSALFIIIIDNNASDRMTLKKAFDKANINYSLKEFARAKESWETIVNNDSDCLFINYQLPDTNGLKLLKRIRSRNIRVPIVIVTSDGDEKIAVELMKAGATDYLVKHRINLATIKKTINNISQTREIERKRVETEHALEISQLRLKEAQKIAKIGNWEYTFEDNKMYWSDEMYEIFEVDPKTYTPDGEYFMKVFHPDDTAKIREGIDRAMSGEVINLDVRIMLANGDTKFVNFNAYFQYEEDDNFRNFVGTVQDINQRKLDEKELIEAKKIAEELGKVKEQFLTNMSHEIRTPMNAILGFTDLLIKQRANLSDEQIKYINSIQSAGEHLLVIINDILDVAKIQAGKLTIEKVDFKPADMLNDLVYLFKPKAEEKKIQLQYSVDQRIPPVLKGDPVRLNQILVNILSNAMKFTSVGFVRLDVRTVKTEEDRTFISFEVSDTGIGIEKEKIESIFESFTQASSDTTRKFGGTGLGLTIVKSIVEMLDGKLTVSSKLGKGTTFRIELAFEISKVKEVALSSEGKTETDKSRFRRDLNVLMAEDNEMNQELARSIFKDLGWHLDIAENGKIAIDKMKTDTYDIVLMDIQMPELDGYKATQIIRHEFKPPICDVPIIAITAHAFGSEAQKCMDAGMNDYLSKPFDVKVLINRVMALLDENDGIQKDELEISPKVEPDEQEVVNLNYLFNVSGSDKSVIKNILNLISTQTPERIERLKSFLADGDWKNLQELCHQMKSSFMIVGAIVLKNLVETIEFDCRNNNFDTGRFSDLISEIESLSNQAIDTMNEEICKMH